MTAPILMFAKFVFVAKSSGFQIQYFCNSVFTWVVLFCAFLADRIWGETFFQLPKARLIKAVLVDLELYGNVSWLDDKHGERPHQQRKNVLLNHNNNQDSDNLNLMNYESDQVVVLYCMNGGRYGVNLQCQWGHEIRNWKNPHDETKPFPLVEKYVMPVNVVKSTKICIGNKSSEKGANCNMYLYLLMDHDIDGLVDILNDNLGWQLLDVNELIGKNDFKCYQIFSWYLTDGLKSFNVNTRHESFKNATLLMYNSQIVIAKVFVSIHVNGTILNVFHGKTFDIHYNQSIDEDFVKHGLTAFNYINIDESVDKWHLMQNIEESVMLIHQHVLPSHLALQCNDTTWFANIIDKSNDFLTQNEYKMDALMPCGFFWQCTKHQSWCCQLMECNSVNKSNRQIWKLLWHCNQDKNPKFWVWQSAFGWLPALGDDRNLKQVKYIYNND